MRAPGLLTRGLVKRYGDRVVLSGVNLRIERGEIMALLGRNGAGKTTLASIAAGLRTADEGSAAVDGFDVATDLWAARGRLGYAGQETSLYPLLTGRENLWFFGRMAGLAPRRLRRRIAEVSRALDLEPWADRQIRELSGGERRRVHVAAAMLHRPALLILDEPTAGVDTASRAAILDLVQSMAADGCAVCYSTHYLTEVERLGGSVAILHQGRLVAHGPSADLVARHTDPFVELQFDGDAPTPPGRFRYRVDGDVLRVHGTDRHLAAAVLTALGPEAGRLRLLRVVEPSIESAFVALTQAEGAAAANPSYPRPTRRDRDDQAHLDHRGERRPPAPA